MIPEIAHLATIVAFASAIALAFTGFYGSYRRNEVAIEFTTISATTQCIALFVALVLLIYCFYVDDFSVLYVASNSNSMLPWYYKITAVWGAHEGSFLWWTFVTSGWTMAVALSGKHLSMDMRGYVLGTLGLINVAFLLFLLDASNPFLRLAPHVPIEGADLNPVLQDFGLIIHPPLLHTGYVGFCVAFAFAVAALITGRVDSAWARWSRPWTNLAWAFLTVGIALGSWWAYYELGWGGWWFWDPVENASFMPWLAGTALIHSLSVTEKRGAFKSWTVLLALLTFILCLTGAFLVRSGVLTSVHAFAIDPGRGKFLLWILFLVGASSLILYAIRSPTLRSRVQHAGLSREFFLLVNNALLTMSVATILLYTIYPLFYEWITNGDRQSIGPPYFNGVFVPVMLVLTFCLALAPISRWKRTPSQLIKGSFKILGIASAFGLVLPVALGSSFSIGVSLALALAIWVLLTHVLQIYRQRGSYSRSFLGMAFAHMGFAIAVIGIAVTSIYSHTIDARLRVGDEVSLNDRIYRFAGVETVQGANYTSDIAEFRSGDTVLFPERRRYASNGMVTTEAGIKPGFTRDLYVSLGEPLENGTWGVRVQDKPLVRWIWLGALIAAFAGVFAVMDTRYRRLALRHRETIGQIATNP